MPDIFSGNWVTSPADLKPAGVHLLRVAASDAPTVFYTLGIQREGDVVGETPNKPDTFLRPMAWGFYFNMKFQSIHAASLTLIQALDKLITKGPLIIVIEMADGTFIYDSDGSKIGAVRWKLES